MATSISIPGGSGAPPLVFTVTGTSTTNYAVAFANAVNAASNAGSLTINVLSNGAQPQANAAGNSVLNEMLAPTAINSFTLTAGGEYSLALAGVPTTVNGSAAGMDTVLAGGNLSYVSEGATVNAGGSVTYIANGGMDVVDFVAGNNTFVGNSASGDIVTGGAGSDSIFTGTGATTAFSGAGNTLIDLSDTAPGGDLVYLGDGNATVNADGANDTVVAGTNGQTIFTGAGNVLVNILDNETSTGAAGDTVVAGAGNTTVFDSVGGSGIFGGAGQLVFVGEANQSFQPDFISAGTGSTAIFGASGNYIAFSATAENNLTVTAGTGNETLNGAGSSGSFSLFANATDTAGSLLAQGGAGNDYFATGAGTESLYGGAGTNVFSLDTTASGHGNITIYDFSASDSVSVDAANQANAANGTVSGGNYTITLSDDTTVTFVGITSLSGHII